MKKRCSKRRFTRIHDHFLRDPDFRKSMLDHDRDEDVCLKWYDLAEQDFTCQVSWESKHKDERGRCAPRRVLIAVGSHTARKREVSSRIFSSFFFALRFLSGTHSVLSRQHLFSRASAKRALHTPHLTFAYRHQSMVVQVERPRSSSTTSPKRNNTWRSASITSGEPQRAACEHVEIAAAVVTSLAATQMTSRFRDVENVERLLFSHRERLLQSEITSESVRALGA